MTSMNTLKEKNKTEGKDESKLKRRVNRRAVEFTFTFTYSPRTNISRDKYTTLCRSDAMVLLLAWLPFAIFHLCIFLC